MLLLPRSATLPATGSVNRDVDDAETIGAATDPSNHPVADPIEDGDRDNGGPAAAACPDVPDTLGATGVTTPEPPPPPTDYPVPAALIDSSVFVWDNDTSLTDNLQSLARRLTAAGDLFRSTAHGGGLILAAPEHGVPTTPIRTGRQAAPVVLDRVRVEVRAGGKRVGSRIPSGDLDLAVRSEVFLRAFRPVDAFEDRSRYLPDFRLTQPGYNDGGRGRRILHFGGPPRIEEDLRAVSQFLDVMAFATPADRTNAVAAALTVVLRHLWPGAKPCLVVTSTKSHGGKDTVVRFAVGTTPQCSISYEATDWALQRSFVAAVRAFPETGVVVVENARLDRRDAEIRSAFLERFLTEAEPVLDSAGVGTPTRRSNDLIAAITTNAGSISTDLMNRALPIHLAPVGDVADRTSPIGNPKHDFLPKNRERIEAELHGMVARWDRAGRPRGTRVQHPFTIWAEVVGGILEVNGFVHFLSASSAESVGAFRLRKLPEVVQ